MRKIDKSNIRSTKYKEWVDGLGDNHPAYSSSHRFITDIKMSLLACQKGLCAYTEELLCDKSLLDEANWQDGKYTKKLDNQNLVNGDIEHFDCSLKNTQAYLWDNLFMVNSNINCRVKGTLSVDNILKPDRDSYDPYIYLDFDYETNVFRPKSSLSSEEQERVKEMIQILGINSNAFKRARLIKDLKENIEMGLELNEPDEYITAWSMTKDALCN
jgi:hypothetical protein